MKNLSLGKQAEIVKATIPQPYTIEFQGEAIEINPVLGLNQKKDFTEIVWSLYYNADKDGNFDFRPYTFDFAIRLATIYCYTNVKIDLAQDVEKYYLLAQYSGLYEAVIDQFSGAIERDYKTLRDASKEYVDRKCNELLNIQAFTAKSQIDMLIEELLAKASILLDAFRDENGDVSAKEILAAVGSVKELADQDKLVSKILDFRFAGKDGEEKQDEHGAETTGVSELGGGSSED